MGVKDNRQFIEALERTGDVARIKDEIDWDIEAGAILRHALELDAPAPFMEKIRDYPPGYRIFGGPTATHRRMAIAMGAKPDGSLKQLQELFEKRMEHPLKPILVKDGPCKENILTGKKVDLYNFPAPMVHEGDGGRYIGTWDTVITRDPDSDWTNWGMYRVMVHKKDAVSIALHVGNQGGKIFYGKYAPRKKPMPVAISVGPDPLSGVISATRIGSGLSEVEYAGALQQQPIEIVKCETSDIMVPAYAEIVLEGEVMPDTWCLEAPFGEFTGYRTGRQWKEICRIKAITFRNNPILTMANPGIPGRYGSEGPSLARVAALKKVLRECGIPFVDLYIPVEMVGLFVVVSVKRTTQGNIATQIWNAIRSRGWLHPLVMVVEDDVDVYNMAQVLHTLATRCNPATGMRIDAYDVSTALIPYLNQEQRQWRKGASALFDCTWPVEWTKEHDIPPVSSFNSIYSEDIRKKVEKNWKKWGL